MRNFVIGVVFVMFVLVACQGKAEQPRNSNLVLVDKVHDRLTKLSKFHDNASNVTCYTIEYSTGVSISCLPDNAIGPNGVVK